MKATASKKKSVVSPIAADVGAGRRFGIVVSEFHRDIGEKLLAGARKILIQYGAADKAVEVVWVPGCFELPIVLKKMAMGRRFDGLIALGLVIKGETPHFDFVAGEAARGIAQVAYDFGIPVGFGVLTTLNVAQALERSGGRVGNKGEEAALAVLQTFEVLRGI